MYPSETSAAVTDSRPEIFAVGLKYRTKTAVDNLIAISQPTGKFVASSNMGILGSIISQNLPVLGFLRVYTWSAKTKGIQFYPVIVCNYQLIVLVKTWRTMLCPPMSCMW